MRSFVLSIFMLISASSFAQKFSLQLVDTQTNQPIPYAHISSEGKLVAITDHFGRARILRSTGMSYQVSCIGYRPLKFSDQPLSENQMTVLKLNPDQKILNAVTITPTKLEDMIREVYDNIPSAYVPTSHLLIGELVERYMDTLGHVHISSTAQLQVQKSTYSKPHNKGEVKVDSLSRVYDVTQPLYAQIHAGAHIPHRFDFVMKRVEFINPPSYSKYNYEYLGELMLNGRLVDVIGFEPNPKSMIEGQFGGKLYLDMKEKVFLKAEYHYTKTGIFSNPESRWVDRRQFITEYKPTNQGWCFAYTWDEAVRKSDNFLLSQYFKTSSVSFDTIADWTYEERTHFHDIVEREQADTMIVINEMPRIDSIPQVQFTRNSSIRYKLASKIEMGFGIRLFSLNQSDLNARATVDYNGEAISIDQQFSIPSVDLGIQCDMSYPITDQLFVRFGQSLSFSQMVKKGNWDLGMMYRIKKEHGRPSDFNFLVSYGENLSRFKFDKQGGIRPFYQQRFRGLTGGVRYHLRLNAMWKIGLGYNYFYTLGAKEKFYLKEHYGLFDMFSKKHKYSSDLMDWEINEETQDDPVNIFNHHSFDISLVMALQ